MRDNLRECKVLNNQFVQYRLKQNIGSLIYDNTLIDSDKLIYYKKLNNADHSVVVMQNRPNFTPALNELINNKISILYIDKLTESVFSDYSDI
jgi:hypothetical protein